LGAMYMLGDKVPTPLKVFLTALAIVDDLGAVLVIALFYTSQLNLTFLFIGITLFILLLIFNRLGFKITLFYAIIGIAGVWLAFLLSSVHATIVAVLAASATPDNVRVSARTFTRELVHLKEKFLSIGPGDEQPDLTDKPIHT